MVIRHDGLHIPSEAPFLNCKLDRSQYAEVLTTVINTYSEGFVLAINGSWGCGKTTFVKMWQASLANTHKTIYFNAWENDFDNEPLTALLGEFKSIIPDQSKFTPVIEKAATFAKYIIPTIADIVAKHYLNGTPIVDVIHKASEASAEIFEEETKKYLEKKKGIEEFKEELKNFIDEQVKVKPLVVFIDELDRCRPDYAIEVLEKIKHFFSIPGIVFVLSIDKVQLGHAVEGYYGSSKINSTEYLRRFVDLEFKLPMPNTRSFVEYLYGHFQFNDLFNLRQGHGERDEFIIFCSEHYSYFNYSLRQQEKQLAHLRIVLQSMKNQKYLFPKVIIILAHLKEYKNELYEKIKSLSMPIDKLLVEYNSVFAELLRMETNKKRFVKSYLSSLAQIIILYNNSLFRKQLSDIYISDLLIKRDTHSPFELSFNTLVFDHTLQQNLISLIDQQRYNLLDDEIQIIFDKIELTEHFTY